MEPLKPRDKVTQHMTRDGLTLDNQTTGESINISSREAEQDYSAAEPGGTAEKVLERAGDIRERSKAKRAAKDGANTAAQATGPASRLQFTAEEWADPALSKYVHKAEKRADKLDAAKEALPKKRVVTKETVYDEAKGKAKTKLHFDKVEKPAPKLKPNPASRPMEEAGLYLHGKIHEVEHENVGVEGGHKGEELAERQAGKAIRSGIRRHKLKPYRAAAKAEKKAIAANAEYIYQKSLRDNPEMAQAVKNPVARFWQKQKIKRDYAKAARAAGQTAQGAASATKTTAAAAKKAAEKSKQAASFVARHWKGVLLIGGVGLMLMLIMGGLQSCTAMFGSAGTGVAATSYLSEDSDMLGAEAAYADMEADLQYELDNYESLHPGYDEYRFDLDEIGHDPYVLTSILSALHEGVYTLGDVQGDLAMLFEKHYTLTQTIETETRYRTETRTDSEGNTYTVQVPYTYYICNVKLENFDMNERISTYSLFPIKQKRGSILKRAFISQLYLIVLVAVFYWGFVLVYHPTNYSGVPVISLYASCVGACAASMFFMGTFCFTATNLMRNIGLAIGLLFFFWLLLTSTIIRVLPEILQLFKLSGEVVQDGYLIPFWPSRILYVVCAVALMYWNLHLVNQQPDFNKKRWCKHGNKSM